MHTPPLFLDGHASQAPDLSLSQSQRWNFYEFINPDCGNISDKSQTYLRNIEIWKNGNIEILKY